MVTTRRNFIRTGLIFVPSCVHGQLATTVFRRRSIDLIGYPATVPGLQFILKPDSLYFMADGDPVGLWQDSTLSGNNASASGTARPTYRTAAFNVGGYPGIEFDGTSDVMSMVSCVYLNRTTGGTLFMVLKWTAPSVSGFITSAMWLNNLNQVTVSDGGAFYTSAATTTAKKMLTLRGLGANLTVRVNKTALSTLTPYTNDWPILCQMGTYLTNWFTGTIGDIIQYNRSLSDAECDAMYDLYLKPKYTLP